MKKNGIYNELESNRLIISGALSSPQIIKALAPLGFDRKEIMNGNSLLARMSGQQEQREQEENLQKASTRKLRDAFKEANALYITHLKFARMTIPPNSQAWHDMKLEGKRRRDMAGWFMQVKAFYKYAGAVSEQLAQRGITAEELAQVQAMIEAVADARVEQNKYRSSKQVAKVRRDEERKALQLWMSKFIKAARFAFDEDKQQLEALGIVVPS